VIKNLALVSDYQILLLYLNSLP